MRPFDFFIYGVVVFGWSTSWLPLKWQLGIVEPEVSLCWRFLLAAPIMFCLARIAGQKLSFNWSEHIRFSALGLCIFSVNFTLFYHAGKEVASGLLAVAFSLASLVNVLMEAALGRSQPRLSHLFAALIGIMGVALLYWPEFGVSEAAFSSLLMCFVGTLFFCSGNMISAKIQRRGVPVIASVAWGMTYGTLFLSIYSFIMGYEFTIVRDFKYLGGLVWLAIFSSVATFSSYLLLIGRIGASRAGYATVIFPVFALLISTIFEDYQWSTIGIIGVMLVVSGNILMLNKKYDGTRRKN